MKVTIEANSDTVSKLINLASMFSNISNHGVQTLIDTVKSENKQGKTPTFNLDTHVLTK